MINTLAPVYEAYQKALADRKDFVQLLQNMKTAAEKRKDFTEGLVAKIGRASRLDIRLKPALEAEQLFVI